MYIVLNPIHYYVITSHMHRPLIQNKLSVLSQAGLAKDDFSSAESAVLTAKVSKDLSYVAIPCVTV